MLYYLKFILIVGFLEFWIIFFDLEIIFWNNDLIKYIKVVLIVYIVLGIYLFKVKNYKEYGILGV